MANARQFMPVKGRLLELIIATALLRPTAPRVEREMKHSAMSQLLEIMLALQYYCMR